MRETGPTGQEARSWTLDDGFAALATLRQELRSYLALQNAPVTATADIVLATQEAAKNALRASLSRPVTVRVWMTDGVVWLSVRDRGHGLAVQPSRLCPNLWSTHGRGLCLMSALMDEVQIEHRRGTRVLMCRRLDLASSPPGRQATVAVQPA